MMSLTASSSSGLATMVSTSQSDVKYMPPQSPGSSSPSGSVPSASSSQYSLSQDDEENVTITASRSISRSNGQSAKPTEDSEELRWLAISSLMTELTYTISDVQARIFEIQELRHKTHSADAGVNNANTAAIDASLMKLDEKLEIISKGMTSVNDSLEPLKNPLAPASSIPIAQVANMLRKQEDLLSEWECVQEDTTELREELKEDKWLTVFRTVTDQADGMMSSLEKAVARCQDFIDQIRRREDLLPTSHSQPSLFTPQPERAIPTIEIFTSLLESFEAKKKHYMPATTKVLSIIDRGVQDRVTKNGETLRRHADTARRWTTLKERITRTEIEMEQARRVLLGIDTGGTPSEVGSNASGSSRYRSPRQNPLSLSSSRGASGRAVSSSGGGRGTPSGSGSAKSLTRSISPLRKFARKLTGSTSTGSMKGGEPITPLSSRGSLRVAPASDPARNNKRSSLLHAFRPSQPSTPVTPDRPSHKYSYSLTPESSPGNRAGSSLGVTGAGTSKSRSVTPNVQQARPPAKPRWNSSTNPEGTSDSRMSTIKASSPRRAPSSTGVYPENGSPYKRSLSRTSMASSRPWSPVSSSVSSAMSSNYPPPPLPLAFRPPSRARTPSSYAPSGVPATPRTRPKTPSSIPAPRNVSAASSATVKAGAGGMYFDDSRSVSPTSPRSPSHSTSNSISTSNSYFPPRPPSRSKIPIPSLKLHSASRPSSAMSYLGDEGTPSSFRSHATRAQTPEFAMRARVQQIPFYQGGGGATTPSPRPGPRPLASISAGGGSKLPPSSYRDSPSRLGSSSGTSPSRPLSRAGAGRETPTGGYPVHEYVPRNMKDPLDVEIAVICNSVAHGLLVERVDPPMRGPPPKAGEEIMAQYAFSNSLARKVVTCRLTTLSRLSRSGGPTVSKKVMCRVGGGWQDLQMYLLNRQAGL